MTKGPRIIVSKGNLSKAVIVRILPGSDIIEGIEETCRKQNINAGAIVSCIGSLQRVKLMIAVPLDNKIGAGYSKPVELEGPLELISGQGTIGQGQEGETTVHMHGVVSDKRGNLHGGHFVGGENPVLITCEIMVAQIDGIRIAKSYDPEVGMEIFLAKEG